jgi:DUF1365 family protein
VRSALYEGTLVHARRTPQEHVFRYGVCFYVLDLDELADLDRRLRLFSYNGRNVFAFCDRDHLGDAAQPVKDNVVALLGAHGIDLEGGRVLLLTNLRVLGYVFNPVSFFYCYDRAGALSAVVAEVSNTFGERWPYLLRAGDGSGLRWEADKRLHVSPFFGMDQRYAFALAEPGPTVFARIDVHEHGTRRFGSVLAGERRQLTDASLARAFVRYRLMPARVTAAIHWQAFLLSRKGVPFHPKPPAPPGSISIPPAVPLTARRRRVA